MADVIGSRELNGEALSAALGGLVSHANKQHRKVIASPLTVTLGDEFQGVVKTLPGSVELLHGLEAQRRAQAADLPFALRYVLHEGTIDSPINSRRAHGMVGPGLTRARELLSDKFRGKPKYTIEVDPPELSAALGEAFLALEAVESRWSADDYPLVAALLASDDDEAVAGQFKRHRTSVARRRETLQISAFQALHSLQLRLSRTEQHAWKQP
ncbi:MAG: SatD family protein [Opitutales bacterium]